MGLLSEFKKFAMRGNVVDMAVGVVIGGAFGLIVTEIVGKVITPIIGYLQGGVDFKERVYTLQLPEIADGMKPPVIGYGAVLQAILNFIIVAFVLFLVIKAMNRMVKKEEAAPAPPSEEILLLREIRDALNKR
ncbi:large-conductance mechanosensitive channel protein MscL [Lacipirellula parvula]|uniref:Large-conductance mechanosensitive channel n=1 Tax=Lacipirellula parvula TaxID=2650471 RepID=A0A5K7XEY7_9BACT|nr:large-conductance mechanosensitive channel protein MscL [Lacipirellula parvula]BBO32896.1 large-conductance mechanosensitive channel [Lacipirellula parvula]